MRHAAWLFVLPLLFPAGVREGNALTIYRIGGESAPLPDLDVPLEVHRLDWGDAPPPSGNGTVAFVQLPWAGVDEKRHGLANLVEITQDFIEPQRLDPDVNLTPLIRERGGSIKAHDGYGWKDDNNLDLLLDGDLATAFHGDGPHTTITTTGRGTSKALLFDLAGAFLIRRVRFHPTTRHFDDRFVTAYMVGTNDGDPLKDGHREEKLVWRNNAFIDFDVVVDVTENTESVVDLQMPPRPVHFLVFVAPFALWEIAEFEIYGDGFAPFASYVSNVIDLGGAASFGDLVWSGRQDPGAQVDLTMRSGNDDDPNFYWRQTFRGDETSRFDLSGKPLTRSAYGQLEGGERAGITPDTQNWEFWTPPLAFRDSSAVLVGDRPRQFVQLRAEFEAVVAFGGGGGRLDYLEFAVTRPPVASEVRAEISPVQVEAGEITPFTYKLRPEFESGDLGFDSIQIDTPIQPVSVDSVRIAGVEVDPAEWGWAPQTDPAGFVVRIPRIDLQRTGELIEVVFRAEVFRAGTVFSGKVFDSTRPHEVRQRVTPGDADALAEHNSLGVTLKDVERQTIRAVHVSPAVLTPNGDGINDVLEIEYDLVNLEGAVPVALGVYNLAGERVVEVDRSSAASGRFFATWHGKNARGEILPPGFYLLRLEVEADSETDTGLAVVSLVY